MRVRQWEAKEKWNTILKLCPHEAVVDSKPSLLLNEDFTRFETRGVPHQSSEEMKPLKTKTLIYSDLTLGK